MAKLVFAHYFPPYPLSLDNKDSSVDWYSRRYLYPFSSSGPDPKGADSYGGLLRDRPEPTPSKSGNWQVQNARIEVAQAKEAGIDGFVCDILAETYQPGNNLTFQDAVFQAAADVGGFYCIPMLDCNGLNGDSTSAIANTLVHYWNYTSRYKIGGAFVFTAFKAEKFSPSTWQSIIDQTGQSVYFVPCFNDYNYATSGEYDSVASGYGIWGYRYPGSNSTGTGTGTQKWMATTVQSHGKIWMQPVSVQDERPNQNIYDEANNTENLRKTFQIAIEGTANWIQIPTWNDYSEGAQIAPSQNHGSTFLDIASYYIQWFKTGAQPPIAKDVLYLTHRKHDYTINTFTGGQSRRQALRTGSARNTVEALVFLTAAATVKINVNGSVTSFSAPAGINAYTAPLGTGTISAEIVRGGTTIASVVSPITVVSNPAVQDLQYYGTSTSRGTVAPPASTTTPTVETPTTTTTVTTIAPGDLATVIVAPGTAATAGLAVDGTQRNYGNLTAAILGSGRGVLAWTENDLDTGTDCLVRIQPVIPATDVTGVDDVGSIVTNYLGGAILQRYLIDNPSYLALFTADPTALGSTANEVVGGSYARLLCSWSAPGSKSSGLGALRFLNLPACTVSHIGVMDALTGGHMLIAKALPAPIPVLASAELRIGANSIVVTF